MDLHNEGKSNGKARIGSRQGVPGRQFPRVSSLLARAAEPFNKLRPAVPTGFSNQGVTDGLGNKCNDVVKLEMEPS